MGVRGLTTFIARKDENYLKPIKLHDTNLVIDGNSIACQLYKWHCVRNDCFGGDYDKYGQTIATFFQALQMCNIAPLVVFDGGYENKKLKTVKDRMRGKIAIVRNYNQIVTKTVSFFPLSLRDVFIETVKQLDIKYVRCDFEADYEIACLARSINSPVLSYDSDFYIYDIQYIPFSTMIIKPVKFEQENPKAQFYLNCQLYKVEHFLNSFGGLERAHLPLLAVLLGNDYINKKIFENFYSQMKLSKRKAIDTDQQRKIRTVIKWLQTETCESAVKKVLNRLKIGERESVANEILTVANGYICRNTWLADHFGVPVVQSDACELKLPDIKDYIKTNHVPAQENRLNIPEWFKINFRNCTYPPCFMDLFYMNTYLCIPQIEDYSQKPAHEISYRIISALHAIITSKSGEEVVCFNRGAKGKIQKVVIPKCEYPVPSFNELQSINKAKCVKVLLGVLNLNGLQYSQVISCFPASWQLYIITVLYWLQNTVQKTSKAHLYALIFCGVVLNCIDKKIGFVRSLSKLNDLPPRKVENINFVNVQNSLDQIQTTDCLYCMETIVSYFQMDVKMTTNVKLFSIDVVHTFAEFQSCSLHIKYLNALLNEPFNNFKQSEFFNGTFIYNLFANLCTRNNIEEYLSNLLKNCAVVFEVNKFIVDKISEAFSADLSSAPLKKKRRRKRKAKSKSAREVQEEIETETDGDEADVTNNRFYLLKNKINV